MKTNAMITNCCCDLRLCAAMAEVPERGSDLIF